MSETTVTMTDVIPPAAPQWDKSHKDLWSDIYHDFCSTLLAGAISELEEKPPDEPKLIDRLHLAARLADIALKEMDFRFYNHGPRNKPRKPARKPAARPKRRR